MSDKNPTRARHAANKKAFTEILGDPFSLECEEGHYNLMKRKSTLHIARIDGLGHETKNPAKPSFMDFFCDVEHIVNEVIQDEKVLQNFNKIYIMGDIESPELTQAERNRLEQRIGRLFRAYHISPVREYFKTIRH